MTLEQFRVRFPEFAKHPDPYVQAFLDDAEAELDATVWGDLYDRAHGLTAAHNLTLSPGGQMARLVNPETPTTYSVHLKVLRGAVTCGLARVSA